MGKLGDLDKSQMNAIQYGAEAGALGQIAQGRSLQRVFGHGQGFQESYNAMANTQADMQNITAKQTTESAQKHFKGLGSGDSASAEFSRVARLQADQKHEEMQGSTDAYERARNVNPNIAREQADLGASTRFKTTQASLDNIDPFSHKNAIDKLSSAQANTAGEQAYQSSIGFEEKVKHGTAYKDGGLITSGGYGSGLEAQTRFDTGQTIANMKNAPENIKQASQELASNAESEHAENYKGVADDPHKASIGDAAMYSAGMLSRNPALALDLAKGLASGDMSAAKSKIFKQQEADKAENARLKEAMSESSNALNAANSGDFGAAGIHSAVQSYTMGAAGTTGTFNASGGFVQGGTQSGVSLSHNTQHSYSSGITANGGSFFAAGATSMGFSADGFAAGASALSAVTQTASLMAGPVGRGSLAAASALGSAASGGAGAVAVRLNAIDNQSKTFAQNQLASIGDFAPATLESMGSRLSSRFELSQERMRGANAMTKKGRKGGLTISGRPDVEKGKAF